MTLILMTNEYDKVSNKAVLRFYDTEKQSVVRYEDQSGFRPYCLAKIDYNQFYLFCFKNSENKTVVMDEKKKKKPKVEEEPEEVEEEEKEEKDSEEDDEDLTDLLDIKKPKKRISEEEEVDSALNETESISVPTFPSLPIQQVVKFNPLLHKEENFVKIFGNTPLDIADQWNMGGVNISRFLICKEGDRIVDNYGYENSIMFRYNYVFDKQYELGMPYILKRQEIGILEPKKCPQCGYTRGYFTYYIRKEGKSDNNVMLGKIVCEGCNEPIFSEEISDEFTDNKTKFQPYFKVNREFDLVTVKKNRIVPILSQPEIQKIDPKIIETVNLLFKNESPQEQALVKSWIPYFFTKIPTDLQRVAMDIEVFVTNKANPDEFPAPADASYPVSCINFTDINKKKITFALHIWTEDGEKPETFPDDIRMIEYSINEERELLREIFKYMEDYPMLVTFNGTSFDLPYLYYRALKLKIQKEEIPYTVKPSKSPMKPFTVTMKNMFHLDLYLLFSCKALKSYAFKSTYLKNKLEDVSKALLPKGEEKLEVLNSDGTKKMMRDYTKYELIYYNYRDSNATIKLTMYDNFIVMNLVFVLMRLSKTGFDDFIDHQVSYWLKNLFFYEHRKSNWLIPQERQIKSISKVSTTAKSKDKQFEGAMVVDTVSGVHFNVIVMDFASLYPSIIKTRNLSYETVDCCNHEECKKNIVPDTTHYVCKIHQGITSLILGSIRDIRVLYFKETEEKNKETIEEYKKEGKKDEALSLSQLNKFFSVMQSALKVFINAGYGVIASEEFYFNQIGAGESVTAYGRYSTNSLLTEVKKKDIQVVMGDSISGNRCIATLRDGKYNVIPISELWELIQSPVEVINDKEVKNPIGLFTLSKNGQWERIKQIIRHKTDKQMYRINQKNGETICTEDHSLIDMQYNPIKPLEIRDHNNKIRYLPTISELQHDKETEKYIDLYPLIFHFKLMRKFGKNTECLQWHCQNGKMWFGYKKHQLLNQQTINRYCNLEELCKLTGFFVAEGHATTSCNKMCFGISNTKKAILEELLKFLHKISDSYSIKIITSSKGIRHHKQGYVYDQTCYAIRSGNNTLSALFMSLCGSGSRHKKVPSFIFNIPKEYQRIFYEYYIKGDGSNGYNGMLEFTTKSLRLTSGLCFLLKSWGIDTGIYYHHKRDVYRVRERLSCNDNSQPIKSVIIPLEKKERYVYDLSIENTEIFVDCCGMLLLHNTDSLGLVNPTDEQVQYFIKWAWDNLGIVLDKDKVCKYMAISSRKKNYLVSYYQKPNIEPDSPLWKKPEIKGLKGKKSNTPQFIKKKFSEIIKYVDMHIMKKEDLDEVKKYMNDFLTKFVKEVKGESKVIEFKDMTYSTRLSKEVVDYGDEDTRDFNRKLLQKAKEGSIQIRRRVDKFSQKKTEEKEKPKSLDERLKIAYEQFEIKGFTQIAKCALLMLKKGVRIGKDDFVPMIKTNRKTTGGALPLSEITTWSQIDKAVYLDEVASSFSQLYDCFDIDADKIIDDSKGKGKSQSLEEIMKKAKKIDPNAPVIPKKEEPKKIEPKKKDTGLYALVKKK